MSFISLSFPALAEIAEMNLGARFFIYRRARYLATESRSPSPRLMMTDAVHELSIRGYIMIRQR